MPVLTKTISNYERQLIQRLIAQEALINSAFNDLVRNVSPHLAKWTANNRNSVWIRNSRIENAIEMELASFHQDVLDIIQAQQQAGWNLSDMKNDSIFKNYIEGMGLSSAVKEGLFVRNMDALAAFQKRKMDGIDLSSRVWNLSKQNKIHIELFLQGGIATGRSAAEIARDLRQYLNNPDKRFRRVLNPKTGKLELSKPARNYHPGQGVYRSAVQNALRISRTETNMAYRSADHERWKDNETILGVEVKLSNAHPMVDICDYMQGQYPKGFKFIGWHPNCICYSVPVLLSQDDFVKHLHGDLDASKQYVQTLPDNANKYIAANTTRFRGWKNEPYWLQDNFVFKNGAYVPKMGNKRAIKLVVESVEPIKPKHESLSKTAKLLRNGGNVTNQLIRDVIHSYASEFPNKFHGKLNKVSIRQNMNGMMHNSRSYNTLTGRYAIENGNSIAIRDAFYDVGGGYNPAQALKEAFVAIQKNKPLTFNQEYAVESLWHEIRHAGAKGWHHYKYGTDLRKVPMETLNQFCARHSYDGFLKQLGGKAYHQKAIIEEGFGYKNLLDNFRTALKHYSIDEKVAYNYFKDIIQSKPYEDMSSYIATFFKQYNVKAANAISECLYWRKSEFMKLLKGDA
ncbi:hypothetical protein KDU71_07530 [Carboxylicivirga sediminis]|uniref:Uncharacterized protein n=1 Tax=Carboxylicivirga sediminis TaxID=2006564 RepID=A0A941IY38_9BACT|nr:hypothetical protein [Carboxylicivirga sediminis]MBR8535407.1 hypothetical protein [Carboxylicivirga sediminis]